MGEKLRKSQFVLKPGYQDKWDALTNFLAKHDNEVMTVTIDPGEPKTRTLSANALQAVWIREIADWQGDSEHNVRLWVKAKIALPILCRNVETEDEKIRAKRVMWTLKRIGYFEMSDEQKMNAMDIFDVTSVMTTRQHKRFRDQMQAHYGNAGLILEVR